jgi:environmental stress-induced protein Ves
MCKIEAPFKYFRRTAKLKPVLIGPEKYRTMNWKNGGGQSTEILVFPPHANFFSDAFLWRFSSSRILNSGPFSQFQGYDRFFVLISGGPLKLQFENGNGESLLRLNEVLKFSGDEKVNAELVDTPVSDLNLIFRRDQLKVQFEVIQIKKKPRSFRFEASQFLIFGLSGVVDVSVYPGEFKYQVHPNETLFIDLSEEVKEKDCLILLEPKNVLCSVILIELDKIE